MKFHTDYTFEKFVLNSHWESFPNEVKEYAKMCAIDLLGALILGSQSKQFKIGLSLVKSLGLRGEIKPIGSYNSFNLLGASIAMGHASNSFDIDDGHRLIQGHPGASFIGGVLSAAYQKNISIQEFLETLIICYEGTIRWAIAMQNDYNYLHSSGTYGAFGTAMGISRILKLSQEQLNNALSIADFHAPMTPVMRSVERPSMNKDGVPFGSLIGTMAVLETLAGSTGKSHLLENKDYRKLLEDLGIKYYILDLYFKPYTCCRWAHQPIKAILDFKANYNFKPDEIKSVKIKTFKSACLLSKKIPDDTEEAQYNIAFPVAAALVKGDVNYCEMNDEAIKDIEVLNMMSRLEFVVSEEYERDFPAKRQASIEITLMDGKTLCSGTYNAPGEPEDPQLNLDWIKDKFKRITNPFINKRQNEIIDIIEFKPDYRIRELVNLINDSYNFPLFK